MTKTGRVLGWGANEFGFVGIRQFLKPHFANGILVNIAKLGWAAPLGLILLQYLQKLCFGVQLLWAPRLSAEIYLLVCTRLVWRHETIFYSYTSPVNDFRR